MRCQQVLSKQSGAVASLYVFLDDCNSSLDTDTRYGDALQQCKTPPADNEDHYALAAPYASNASKFDQYMREWWVCMLPADVILPGAMDTWMLQALLLKLAEEDESCKWVTRSSKE